MSHVQPEGNTRIPFSALLPGMLDHAAAAVLVVDVMAAEVVYANDQARALAGRVNLPLAVDDWSRLAGLIDAVGRDLADSDGPLSRVCRGLPIAGEIIGREPRRASGTAQLERTLQAADGASSVEDVAGPLWVTGFPLEQVRNLAGHALLVFLRMRDDGTSQDGVAALDGAARGIDGLGAALKGANAAADEAGSTQSARDLYALRHRAVLAMDVSFTIADATRPDLPLIWANPAFTRATGYSFEDVVNTNCRFLQGEDTDRDTVGQIRDALVQGQPITRTLLNYRRDGTAFWNEIAISPVRDAAGELTNFVGIQADVTARVVLETERTAAYVLEKEARAAAERARAQTALLAEAGRAVTQLDSRTALSHLLGILVGEWAGWGAAYVADHGALVCVATAGTTDEALARHSFPPRRPPDDLREALDRDAVSLVPSMDPDGPYARAGDGPLVVAPLTMHGILMGVLLLGAPELDRAGDDRTYLDLVDVIASRVVLGLDIARLYARQQELAEKLQRALLPHLPDVDGLDLWGYYAASGDGAKIGGDWYDVVHLGDGRTVVAIGDVVGHDVDAATSMGRLRAVMQSYALEGLRPGELVDRLDAAIRLLRLPHLATVCVAVLEQPTATRPGTLRWSAAGHPPPMLRRADGTVRVLTEGSSPMLGAPGITRGEACADLAPGDALLLYTDGLVEKRGRLLSAGIDVLRESFAQARGPGAEALGLPLRPARPDLIEDDAALLVARLRAVED